MNYESILRNNFIYLPSCHSTNDIAMEMVKNQPVAHGTVVITDHQTNGKGQMGSLWEAQPGENLTFSVIYRTDFIEVQKQFDLNIAITGALQRAISKFIGNVKIKWPNDIFSADKKVAGVLIENTLQGNFLSYSVIGIGVNINQEKFDSPNAASFFTLTDKKFDLEQVLLVVLRELDAMIVALTIPRNMQELLWLYLKNMYRKGILSRFESKEITEGTIEGVDELGRLIVKSEGKIYYFNNKEIVLLN